MGLRGEIWVSPVVSGLLLGACSIRTGVSDYPPDWPDRVTGHASSCRWIDGEYADKGVYDLRGMDYPRSGQVTTAYGLFFRDAGYILAAANPDIANFADSIRLNWLEEQGLRITAMRAGADVTSLIAAKAAVACNGDVITVKGTVSVSGGDFELVGVDRKTMTLERASDGSLVVHTVFRRNSLQLLVFPFRERGDGWFRFAPGQAAPANTPSKTTRAAAVASLKLHILQVALSPSHGCGRRGSTGSAVTGGRAGPQRRSDNGVRRAGGDRPVTVQQERRE
jgi:hypothetical protein